MMLVPTAASILEDKLPPYASGGDEKGYWDKIKDSDLGDIRWINVFPVLEADKEQPLYYKTDHHWTTKGAFLAYRELGAPMSFSPMNEADFNIRQVTSQFYGSLYSKSGFRHLQPDSIELYYSKTPGTFPWSTPTNSKVRIRCTLWATSPRRINTLFFQRESWLAPHNNRQCGRAKTAYC